MIKQKKHNKIKLEKKKRGKKEEKKKKEKKKKKEEKKKLFFSHQLKIKKFRFFGKA